MKRVVLRVDLLWVLKPVISTRLSRVLTIILQKIMLYCKSKNLKIILLCLTIVVNMNPRRVAARRGFERWLITNSSLPTTIFTPIHALVDFYFLPILIF